MSVGRRKLTVLVCVYAALIVGVKYLVIVPRIYETLATVRVQSANPKATEAPMAGGLVQSPADVMRSTPVLALTLSSPQVHNLTILQHVPRAIDVVLANLTIRPKASPGVYDLVFTSSNPTDARVLLDALVAAYIHLESNRQVKSMDELTSSMREQQEKTAGDLAAARQRLNDEMKRQRSLSLTPEARQDLARQRSETGAALADASRRALDANILHDQAVEFFGGEDRLRQAAQAPHPVIGPDVDVAALRDQLLTLRQSLSAADAVPADPAPLANRPSSGPSSPPANHSSARSNVAAESHLAMTPNSGANSSPRGTSRASASPIAASTENDASARRADYQRLSALYAAVVSDRYRSAVDSQAQLQARFDDLEKQAHANEALDAESAQLQGEIERLTASDDSLNDRLNHLDRVRNDQLAITILANAETDNTPIWPLPMPVLAIAGVAGFLVGCLLAVALDKLSFRLLDPRDAASSSRSPLLGNVPPMPKELSSAMLRGQCVRLRSGHASASRWRSLKASIERSLVPGVDKTVLVTAAVGSRGKSLVASNIAISLAEAGQRVALVDGHPSKPAMNVIFGIDDVVGLSNAIEGTIQVMDALHVTGLPGLEILPAGSLDADWAELLNRPEFPDVLGELTDHFDRVIIDGASASAVECRIISAFCDATLLIADARQGRRRALRSAAEGLRSVGTKIIGIVWNDPPSGRSLTRSNSGGQQSRAGAATSRHAWPAEPDKGGVSQTMKSAKINGRILAPGSMSNDPATP